MSHTIVIAFTNNKGGSGKSTTCANVGYSMSLEGKKVLLIDGDMQMNLTLSFFDNDRSLELAKGGHNLYQALREQKDLTGYICHTAYEGLDIIPSSILMSSIEFELFTMWEREKVLKSGLRSILASEVYDYVLIDAPPTLGCWEINIMCASDYLILPVEASPWGLVGLGNMFEFYEKVHRMTPDLQMLGVAVTKVNERKKYFQYTMDTLKALDRVRVFENYIRVDSTIEWSQENSQPVMAFKPNSRAAKEYLALAKEVMEYACR